MSPLYEKLRVSGEADRLEEANRLVGDMLVGGEWSTYEFGRLVQAVLFTEMNDVSESPADNTDGWFTAESACALLESGKKIGGYYQAIKDAAPFGTAIDAGTGPGAILALAGAIFHGAKVNAYDTNPRSVRCARRIVELLGVEDHVDVHEQDIFEAELEEAGAAFVEMFGPAIAGGNFKERGAEAVARLAEACGGVVISRLAHLHAQEVRTDFMEKPGAGWQPIRFVDLAVSADHIEGSLVSAGGGMRRVAAFCELYVNEETPVLVRQKGEGFARDPILDGVELGAVTAKKGDTIGFRFGITPATWNEPARVWNETTGEEGEGPISAADDVSVVF